MAQERAHQADIGQCNAVTQNEGATRQNRIEGFQQSQIGLLDMPPCLLRHTISSDKKIALPAICPPAFQKPRRRHIATDLVDNLATQKLRALPIGPAIMHGRPPEIFIGIILDQPREKSHGRVFGQDGTIGIFGLQPVNHRCRIRHQPPIGQLHDRHLQRPQFLGKRCHKLLGGHRLKGERNALGAQIGLHLAGEIRHFQTI